MDTAVQIVQIILALGIVNVWLIRFGRPTAFRGGSAKNMKEEFAVYGLSSRFMYIVGFLKLLCALGLLIGLYDSEYTSPSALVLSFLMAGAVLMHFKARDPFKKWVPALVMLSLSLFVSYFSYNQFY